MKASAGFACEGFEQRLEERLRDTVMHTYQKVSPLAGDTKAVT
jgi:hypothetical protein